MSYKQGTQRYCPGCNEKGKQTIMNYEPDRDCYTCPLCGWQNLGVTMRRHPMTKKYVVNRNTPRRKVSEIESSCTSPKQHLNPQKSVFRGTIAEFNMGVLRCARCNQLVSARFPVCLCGYAAADI